MIQDVKKIEDLVFEPIITLSVIEGDDDLKALFSDEIKLPFTTLYRLAKDNKLSDETLDYLKVMFDKLILTKKEYIKKYLQLADASDVKVRVGAESKTSIKVEETEEVKPKTETTSEKLAEKAKLPRRYGKVKIEEDIKKQGGKATEAQLAGLAVNRLKNIYVNLNTRLIKDMLLENKILTDKDYREIKSAVKIVEDKLKHILNTK